MKTNEFSVRWVVYSRFNTGNIKAANLLTAQLLGPTSKVTKAREVDDFSAESWSLCQSPLQTKRLQRCCLFNDHSFHKPTVQPHKLGLDGFDDT